MIINDIDGTKSKPLYKGVAKDILNARDIEGTAPKFERVSIISLKNVFIAQAETLQPYGLLRC